MMMLAFEWFLAIGAVAGLLAGLLGVGGGLIIVPSLIWLYQKLQFSPEIASHLAIGTSLATIVLTSLSSVRTHHAAQKVDWIIFKHLSAGIIVGVAIGALLADRLSGRFLSGLFGVFSVLAAFKLVLMPEISPRQFEVSLKVVQSLAGTVIGAVSTLLGIGGGTLTVPFLTWCGVEVRRAIGTSAACGFPIALFGAMGYAAIGLDDTRLPEGSTGYIYWPAFLGIAISSTLFAHVGARLAHRLPSVLLKRIFAVLLCFIGAKLIWTGLVNG